MFLLLLSDLVFSYKGQWNKYPLEATQLIHTNQAINQPINPVGLTEGIQGKSVKFKFPENRNVKGKPEITGGGIPKDWTTVFQSLWARV